MKMERTLFHYFNSENVLTRNKTDKTRENLCILDVFTQKLYNETQFN